MEEKILSKVEEKIKSIIDKDITPESLEWLYKLTKIRHMAKEDKEMYGNYSGRGPGHGAYGEYGNYGNYSGYGANYGNYGRRGYDSKYRGYEALDRMGEEYGRYQDYGAYGAGEDTKKSLKYMLQSMEDFARMLKEDAKSQEEVQMIRETAQRIAQM